MDKLDSFIKTVTSTPTGNRQDDAFTDRLSNRYTVAILIASALIVTTALYVGEPINCWGPVHFTKNHVRYMNAYCWVRSTYYVPWNKRIPREDQDRDVIPYYQWIPFILLAQAILFYIPKAFWNTFNQKVGVDADNILQVANKLIKAENENSRNHSLKLIANQFHRCLTDGGKYDADRGQSIRRSFCRTNSGNYLSLLYMFSKLLYIANVVGQLFMLNTVLATEYSIYGIELLKHLRSNDYDDWTKSLDVAFPRVTYCDMKIRRVGNTHRYTVQCLLPINLYTEKIYMFLWFWMVFLAFCTCLDFCIWFVRHVWRWDRIKYVRNHLVFHKHENNNHDTETKQFVDKYLKQDGVFLLRLIGHNTNSMAVTDITCKLLEKWRNWKIGQQDQNQIQRSPDDNTCGASEVSFEPLL